MVRLPTAIETEKDRMIHTKQEWGDRLFNIAALVGFGTAIPYQYSLWIPAIILSVVVVGCVGVGMIRYRQAKQQ
jgi:hypothetical protein